ncbi:MAG: VWA domain-containing protein [Methylicorpusculum sp.]|uniref:VWA domain-containing protein n=1 Tax=Methylicorpusculum TaxID=2713642 RepID=UPI00135697EA|nr:MULTISPECIES: VWA domain-containing protein [Methylicorpusculum]MCD2452055.1 VWA domain-containing protein [Methylicorpusculum oleiharenae]MDP2203480.1 VWA domain-containing protein [Methylicorpusculum sp.]
MKNQTLNNAFPIVAAALGNKFGVKVSVGGEDAYTTGDRIHLPALDTDDSNIKDVAWGYLAHEAAHVRFTDFGEFRNAATSPLRKHIVNILEDIRIEKAMQEPYPGTKRTTEKVTEYLVQTDAYGFVTKDQEPHPASVLSQFLLFRLRHDVLGQKALSSLADSAESLLEDTFPAGAITRLFGLLSDVPSLRETRDCVRLADQILRMIQEEQEKAEEQARQQAQQQQSSSSNAGGQSNSSDDADADDQSDDTSSGDTDDSQPNQSSQPDDAIPQTDTSDADDDNADQQSGQGATSSRSGADDQSQDADQLAQILSSALSAGQDDLPDDLFEAAQKLLGNQPRNSYDSEIHLPQAMEPNRNPSTGNAILNRALSESGKIRASLQGLIQSSRYERPVNKRSGNRIDGRKLVRLSQGDSRVFERRTHKQAPNTALHLLVDASGSMNNRISPSSMITWAHIAMDSAVALALALEGISGVNPAITRFPHGDTDNVNPLLKHGQKVRPHASAFSAITNGGTPLHTALWYSAASVIATREERKVIMVLTDGEPDDYDAAKSVIRRCEATGIELVGVGICIDTSHLFDNSICISNVSDLRSELFRISKDLLLAA